MPNTVQANFQPFFLDCITIDTLIYTVIKIKKDILRKTKDIQKKSKSNLIIFKIIR